LKTKNVWFWTVTLSTIAVDQATKWWVFTHLKYGTDAIHVIPGFFDIVHAQNPGAAVGLFRDFEYHNALFIGFTIVATIIIANMQRQLADRLKFLPVVLGLILGGAIGNGIDRVVKSEVTDFLRFYSNNPHIIDFMHRFGLPAEYPSFNIADSALVVGVGLFIVHYLFLDEGELDGKKAEAEAEDADPAEGRNPAERA